MGPAHDLNELVTLIRQIRKFAAAGNPRVPPVKFHLVYADGSNLELPLHLLPAESLGESTTSHSDDFASVVWFGTTHTFTVAQRPVVERLWASWEAGMPGVSGDTLLEGGGSEAKRLRDLFKDNPAWGTMIQSVRRGIYTLTEPAHQN
jgi:hypothetical protein